ncbi:MAG TPA: hypothetical protein DCS21_12735 [Gammaproteobacteria bacterium]|nr:hypothetical protein [Gammaproteobacteria bacterium]
MAIASAVRALLHELATPLTVLMSASDILHNRTPDVIQQSLDELRDISHQFGREVVELRTNLPNRIDQQSAVQAAAQIQQWVTDRQRHAIRLAELVGEIQAAAIHLPEPLLDKLLNQSLFGGLSELERVLSRLATLQAGDLESFE